MASTSESSDLDISSFDFQSDTQLSLDHKMLFLSRVEQCRVFVKNRMEQATGLTVGVKVVPSDQVVSDWFVHLFGRPELSEKLIQVQLIPILDIKEQRERTLSSFVKFQISLPKLTPYHCKIALIHTTAIMKNECLLETLVSYHGKMDDCAPWRFNCSKNPEAKPHLSLFNVYYLASSARMAPEILLQMQKYDRRALQQFARTKLEARGGFKSGGVRSNKLFYLKTPNDNNIIHLAVAHYGYNPSFIVKTDENYVDLHNKKNAEGDAPFRLAEKEGCFTYCQYEALSLIDGSCSDFDDVNQVLEQIWESPQGISVKKIIEKTIQVENEDFELEFGDCELLKYLTPAYGWQHKEITDELVSDFLDSFNALEDDQEMKDDEQV